LPRLKKMMAEKAKMSVGIRPRDINVLQVRQLHEQHCVRDSSRRLYRLEPTCWEDNRVTGAGSTVKTVIARDNDYDMEEVNDGIW
jgi:hypothetical protein